MMGKKTASNEERESSLMALIKEDLRNNRLLVGYFGGDQCKLVSSRMQMRFFRPSQNIIAATLTITFGKEEMQDIVDILTLIRPNWPAASWVFVKDTLPPKVKAALDAAELAQSGGKQGTGQQEASTA